jgi:hypothetical protein
MTIDRFNVVVWIADIGGALGVGAWLGTGCGWPWFGAVTYCVGRIAGSAFVKWRVKRLWRHALNNFPQSMP